MTSDSSKICFTIAFYGINFENCSLSDFYASVDREFDRRHVGITSIGIQLPKAARRRNSSKDSGDKILRSAESEGVSGFSVASSPLDAEFPMLEYDAAANISVEGRYASVTFRSDLINSDNLSLEDFASSLVGILRPAYGIGYHRELNRSPGLYAVGILGSQNPFDLDEMESLNVSFWNSAMDENLWERGLLRDVYEWNFLTRTQLDRHIFGVKLEDWIKTHPGRGSIRVLDRNITFWKVDASQILEIKRMLWKAEVLFNWSRDIEGAAAHPSASRVCAP